MGITKVPAIENHKRNPESSSWTIIIFFLYDHICIFTHLHSETKKNINNENNDHENIISIHNENEWIRLWNIYVEEMFFLLSHSKNPHSISIHRTTKKKKRLKTIETHVWWIKSNQGFAKCFVSCFIQNEKEIKSNQTHII